MTFQSIEFWAGDCKTRNETKQNETQQKRNKIKQKRNQTRHHRNETKPNKSSINKINETNINETIFLHEKTIYKMPVADWKAFKIYKKI